MSESEVRRRLLQRVHLTKWKALEQKQKAVYHFLLEYPLHMAQSNNFKLLCVEKETEIKTLTFLLRLPSAIFSEESLETIRSYKQKPAKRLQGGFLSVCRDCSIMNQCLVPRGRCQQQKLVEKRTLNFSIRFMVPSYFQLPIPETTWDPGKGGEGSPHTHQPGRWDSSVLAEEYKVHH